MKISKKIGKYNSEKKTDVKLSSDQGLISPDITLKGTLEVCPTNSSSPRSAHNTILFWETVPDESFGTT